MKLLILDTVNGEHFADLFIIEQGLSEVKKLRLGYVPELCFDPVNNQILVVETELKSARNKETKYWLKGYSADNLNLLFQKETPPRPMYTGFPGRSTRIKSSSSGNYLYFLESKIHPTDIDIYRTVVHRYDRKQDEFQQSQIKIDSCMIDFGEFGENEDQLCFHLACEHPSVVAFADFDSEKIDFLKLVELNSRTFGKEETCGSCFSLDRQNLYCINGEGIIFIVEAKSKSSRILTRLKLKKENYIPLQQIYNNLGSLFVGVSCSFEERGVSLASQIWQLSLENGVVQNKLDLPFPVMNFIMTPDNFMMIGVNPFQQSIVFVEIKTGKILGIKEGIGITPAEVLLFP